MPSNVLKGFAKKSGKSMSDLERYWDEAKKSVKENYPDVAVGSDRYYKIVVGIVKKRAGLSESLSFPETVDNIMQKLDEIIESSNK